MLAGLAHTAAQDHTPPQCWLGAGPSLTLPDARLARLSPAGIGGTVSATVGDILLPGITGRASLSWLGHPGALAGQSAYSDAGLCVDAGYRFALGDAFGIEPYAGGGFGLVALDGTAGGLALAQAGARADWRFAGWGRLTFDLAWHLGAEMNQAYNSFAATLGLDLLLSPAPAAQ
jgi:hypothetical protein